MTLTHSLETIDLFSGLPKDLRHAIEERCRWTTVGNGQVIRKRDDSARNVYFVTSGTVRVVGYGDDGAEYALGDVTAGKAFGELTPVDGDGCSAHVVSDGECVIGVLSGQDYRAILAELPSLTLRLAEELAAHVRTIVASNSGKQQVSPRQQVFAELVQLAAPNPIGDGSWLIEAMPNHDELATRSGTEKTDVAMAIGTLARDGIIERKHKTLVVRDHPRLRMLAKM